MLKISVTVWRKYSLVRLIKWLEYFSYYYHSAMFLVMINFEIFHKLKFLPTSKIILTFHLVSDENLFVHFVLKNVRNNLISHKFYSLIFIFFFTFTFHNLSLTQNFLTTFQHLFLQIYKNFVFVLSTLSFDRAQKNAGERNQIHVWIASMFKTNWKFSVRSGRMLPIEQEQPT